MAPGRGRVCRWHLPQLYGQVGIPSAWCIRVSDILDLLSADAPFEEILEDYPFLERADILAAIDYAACQMDRMVLKTS